MSSGPWPTKDWLVWLFAKTKGVVRVISCQGLACLAIRKDERRRPGHMSDGIDLSGCLNM